MTVIALVGQVRVARVQWRICLVAVALPREGATVPAVLSGRRLPVFFALVFRHCNPQRTARQDSYAGKVMCGPRSRSCQRFTLSLRQHLEYLYLLVGMRLYTVRDQFLWPLQV